MIAKRPSAIKSDVKNNNGGHVRMEKANWRRTIQELLSASNENIIEILTADGILPNWKGCVCVRAVNLASSVLSPPMAAMTSCATGATRRAVSVICSLNTYTQSSRQRTGQRVTRFKCRLQPSFFVSSMFRCPTSICSHTSITKPWRSSTATSCSCARAMSKRRRRKSSSAAVQGLGKRSKPTKRPSIRRPFLLRSSA